MTVLLYILGVLALIVGLMISIALHEAGHLLPAKAFGVLVPRYMIGFGPTLWSFRRGETEYGLKPILLGGYVRMLGMYAPARPGTRTHKANGELTLAEEARQMANEEIAPGQEHRAFYALSVPKKIIVMSGGIVVNFGLAFLCVLIALGAIGVVGATTTVGGAPQCVPLSQFEGLTINGLQPKAFAAAESGTAQSSSAQSSSAQSGSAASTPSAAPSSQTSAAASGAACGDNALAAPAYRAGLRAEDRLISLNGTQITAWQDLQAVLADLPAGQGQSVDLVVERAGKRQSLSVEPLALSNGSHSVAWLGIEPQLTRQAATPGQILSTFASITTGTAQVIVALPVKFYNLVVSLLAPQVERDPEGLMGIVGVGRVAGEIASSGPDTYTVADRVAAFLMLMASLNMTLFMFNLIPLLPLDGGQIVGALYEGVRRQWRRWRGQADLGPADMARALPLTYGVVIFLIIMTLTLIAADIFKPI